MNQSSKSSAYSRREFLGASLAAVSTVTTAPMFFTQTAQVMAAPGDQPLTRSRPGVPEDRILVVVQLSGGNDGMNTVIPYGEPQYYNARTRIAIDEGDVLKLDEKTGVGLHPSLAKVRDMIAANRGAVVQGVGYPNPNRSHFSSMDIWHTGDTLQGARTGSGWIGRSLDRLQKEHTGEIDAAACIAIGSQMPLATQGKHVKPTTFQSADRYRWVGNDLNETLPAAYDAANRAGVLPGAEATSQAAFLMRTAMDAQVSSDRIRKAAGKSSLTEFPRQPLAQQLKTVAAMIRGELPTRIYYVALGGFDTHANQLFRHANLLTQFADGIAAFYAELDAMGQSSRVMTLAFSEFGRRVAQNASNGTDHGAAAPMFLFGDMVKPGMHGRYPSLTDLDAGDLRYNVDFRSVYADVLDRWMKIDSKAVLGQSFKSAGVV